MEPLKKAQVEGFLMFADPEVLFGNLDELCCVRYIEKYTVLYQKYTTQLFASGDALVL